MTAQFRTTFFLLLLLTPTVFYAQDPSGAKRFTNQMVHSASINSVCLSPDGHYALSGSDDYTLKLWNIATGKEVHTFKGHTSLVNSVCFSPDGHYALSGSNDNTLKLWNIATGKEVHTFKGHTSSVNSVCFSPDGHYALSGSLDNTIRLWEIKTGRNVRTVTANSKEELGGGKHYGSVNSVCFSPDGQYALSGSSFGSFFGAGSLKLWQVSTGKEIRNFTSKMTYSPSIESACFSPNGQYVLSLERRFIFDANLTLWEVSSGKVVRSWENGSISSMCFSADGRYILSSYRDTLKLLEVSKGKEIRTFIGHNSTVQSVCMSKDGRYALSGSYGSIWPKEGGSLKFWEVSSGKEVRPIVGHNSSVTTLHFSSDGLFALSGGGDNTLRLWNASSGREIRSFAGQKGEINSLYFNPNGRYALSSYNKEIKLWEISTNAEVRTFTDTTGFVNSACFSPDGRYILSGGYKSPPKLWEVSSGKVIRKFISDSISVQSMCFSPDGRYALSGDGDGMIKLWEVSTGTEIRSFTGHDSFGVYSVCFSPDGRYALSGGWDSMVKLWEISTGQEIQTMSGHWGRIRSVCFSSDGRYALSGSEDNSVRLWSVATGKEVQKWELNYYINLVSFSPDGSQIQVGTAAYFVTFPLPETVRISPLITQNPTTAVFSQIIWRSEPTTIREPSATAKAVVVSNFPSTIKAEQVRVYLNGQSVAVGAKLGTVSLNQQQGRYNWQQTLPLREGENEIVLGLLLPNQPEVRSEPLVMTYLPPIKPNLYVVNIGISGAGLQYAARDAENIGAFFKSQQGRLFNKVTLFPLFQPGHTSTTRLRTEMSRLSLYGITPNDVLLIFVSAHGKKLNLRNGQTDFALQPDDYDNANLSTEENTTLLYRGHILNNIEDIVCKKFILLDACHSGEAVLKQGGKSQYLRDLRDAQEVIKQAPPGIITLASSSDGQLSWEDPSWQQGAFTKALLDGLTGAADTDKDRFVSVNELFSYLQKIVPVLVRQVKKEEQQPQMYPSKLSDNADFPLVQY